MPTIPQKELRNDVADVLRRAEAGEEFTITVAGRPVAQLGPAQLRRWVGGPDLRASRRRPPRRRSPQTSSGSPRDSPTRSSSAGAARHVGPHRRRLAGSTRGCISSASLAELRFGVLTAHDSDERARRAQRLGVIEATFDPLAIDAAVAREWGRLAAAVAERGEQPRRRAVDLAIAATANVAGVPLVTHDDTDFQLIDDLVDVRIP